MLTVHLHPGDRDRAALVAEEIDRLLGEGKRVAVTVSEERRAEGDRLANEFSRDLDSMGAPLE